jgi:drug/metabolite transporter (DMT)-like permease
MLFFSLGAAFTNSLSMTYLHDLLGIIPGTISLHYFYIGQCLFNSILIIFQEDDLVVKNLDCNFYFYVFGFTITAYLMQNFTTRAILLKKASYIMPFGYITVILSAIMDFTLFGNAFSSISIFGMLLTSSGLLAKLFIS